MTVYSATKARASLYRLINQVSETHKPIHITGKKAAAVLISEEDWSAIQETLHLLSIPGMGKSIRDGLKTPLKKCDEELDW
jgi:antitoxin YefM